MNKAITLLSLSLVSSLAMANNNDQAIELTSIQLDNITAGAFFSGTAEAMASAEGNFPYILTQTAVNAYGNDSGTGAVVASAFSLALGSGDTATTAEATTNATGNTRTFTIGSDHQGNFSYSTGIETTIILPSQP